MLSSGIDLYSKTEVRAVNTFLFSILRNVNTMRKFQKNAQIA